MRLERTLGEQELGGELHPLALTRLPSLMVQPAALSRSPALRSSLRSCPDPSLTGGNHAGPNTSGSTLSRNGSSSAISSADGSPFAIISEFWNTESVRS